jgi:poly(3-hydroxyalkanoate) synthetase
MIDIIGGAMFIVGVCCVVYAVQMDTRGERTGSRVMNMAGLCVGGLGLLLIMANG